MLLYADFSTPAQFVLSATIPKLPQKEREKKEKIMMEGWWATTVATAPSFGRLEECSGKLGCFFCVELKSGLLKLFLLFFSETEAKKVMN